jgi:predicted TIM-barrel fold metal-dependent hydrolase
MPSADRIVGVAAVDMSHPPTAVAELRRAVNDLGCKALRVVPWLWQLPPNDKLYFPLYVACIELGIPFCTQVGHTGPLMPSEVGRPVPYLDEVLLTFPELVVVGGHIGHPWTDETIGLAWKHPNFYIDTSAHAPRFYPPQLIHFLETNGRSKVLFGTNWPQLRFDRCVNEAATLELSTPAREAFMGANADLVFGLA